MRRGRLLAVVESKWFANEITSRPLFDLLCDARHERGDYMYERFVSKKSFEEVVAFAIKKKVSYLYIGSHCYKGKLYCPNGEYVPISRLRDVILKASEARGTRLAGVYVSGCYIVNDKNAAAFFAKADNPLTPRWFGGYGGSAEWFPSTAFDTLFFSEYFREKGQDARRIRTVAERLKWSKSGLAKDWKFNIYVAAKDGGTTNLTAG